jgi:hypothetical protein
VGRSSCRRCGPRGRGLVWWGGDGMAGGDGTQWWWEKITASISLLDTPTAPSSRISATFFSTLTSKSGFSPVILAATWNSSSTPYTPLRISPYKRQTPQEHPNQTHHRRQILIILPNPQIKQDVLPLGLIADEERKARELHRLVARDPRRED